MPTTSSTTTTTSTFTSTSSSTTTTTAPVLSVYITLDFKYDNVFNAVVGSIQLNK